MASKPIYETKTTSKQIRRVKVTKTVQKTLPDVRTKENIFVTIMCRNDELSWLFTNKFSATDTWKLREWE